MAGLIEFLRRLFLYGRGRPVALLILLWMTTLNILSEVPIEGTLQSYSSNFTRPLSTARQFLFDSYQKFTPRQPQSQPVTIVAIDEASLASVGQWPWPRNKLAELIDAIAAYQPAAIGLDMYMPEADQTSPALVAENLPADASIDVITGLLQLPSHEDILAQSLAEAPTILGAAGFDFTTFTSSQGMRSAPVLVRGGEALPHLRHFESVLVSLPQLQSAARGQAILSVDLEFGVVRRIPLVAAVNDVIVSGLAMEMFRIATGSPAVQVSVADHGVDTVSVADLVVPTQPGGDIWLHFSHAKDTAQRYLSAEKVMSGDAAVEQLAGKLVLLGLTGSGLHDMRTTALGELVPGIEIQAQVLESLYEGRFVLRPWWMKWLEVGFALLFGSFLIWFIPRTDSAFATVLKNVPRVSVWFTITLNGLLVSLGFILFNTVGLLLDAGSVFLIFSGVIASLISSAIIEIDKEAALEAEKLQGMRETASLIAGELARSLDVSIDIYAGKDPDRFSELTLELTEELAKQAEFSADLDAQAIEHIVRAAPYRDIGMIHIPEDVVSFPGPLSPPQRAILEQHPEVGRMAVESVDNVIERERSPRTAEVERYLEYLNDIVESHHEHWDGTGYPNRLDGDDIPLAARIVAVVDAYVGLTRDRPDRAELSHDEALRELRRMAGAQLDRRIVRTFCGD